MSVFHPNHMFTRIYDIPTEFLVKYGITTLLLDVDNTLTTHSNPIPNEKVLTWLDVQKKAGIRLMLISNNTERRVAPFAKKLGLEYIAMAKKPLKGNVLTALKLLKVSIKETALIGDQIFTDILCARRVGCMAILVEPFEIEKNVLLHAKRWIEKPIVSAYIKKSKKK